jgi:hypothetical protein
MYCGKQRSTTHSIFPLAPGAERRMTLRTFHHPKFVAEKIMAPSLLSSGINFCRHLLINL